MKPSILQDQVRESLSVVFHFQFSLFYRYNNNSASVSFIITFQCFHIYPVPEPTILLSTIPVNVNSLLEGTALQINCSAYISPSVDSDIEVTFDWLLNGNMNLSNSSKYSIYPVTELSSNRFENMLEINELDLSDNSSSYFCAVSVLSNNEHLIGTTSNESIGLGIEGSLILCIFSIIVIK